MQYTTAWSTVQTIVYTDGQKGIYIYSKYIITLGLYSKYCKHCTLLCVAIVENSTGSTSLSFTVNDPGVSPTYDCWVNSTYHHLHRWTKGTITTVSGLDPGTYYNIACQKRPHRVQTCPITHAVVATSKC